MQLKSNIPSNLNLKHLGDLRLNSTNNVEVFKGFIVGSQRTVIIKIPVIAHPQPVPSNFTLGSIPRVR